MNEIVGRLRNIAKTKITKGKLDDIRELHTFASDFMGDLAPTSTEEDDQSDFEDACSSLEQSLDSLDSACDSLEDAEGKDERDDAAQEIADALDEVASGIEELIQVSVPDAEGKAAYDRSLTEFLTDLLANQQSSAEQLDINAEVQKWISDSADPSERVGRQAAVARLVNRVEQRKAEGGS